MRVPVALASALSLLLSGCLVGHKPVEGDSDGDYLPDAVETAGWDIPVVLTVAPCGDPVPPAQTPTLRHVSSNPFEPDSDFDGLTDTEEFQWRSDPMRNDTTGGGMQDLAKRDYSLSDKVQLKGAMKLNMLDSDGDCLPDVAEINGIFIPGIGLRKTDPSVADTDHDGLQDGYEAMVLHTDPTKADTDGDGLIDSIDGDPLHDVHVRLVFDRIHLKRGDGPVYFHYSFSGPNGTIASPREPVSVGLANGENASVPAAASPGKVNPQDTTPMAFQFWVERASDGLPLNVTGQRDPIVTVAMDPKTGAWTAAGRHGVSSSLPVWFSGDDADLAVVIERLES